MVTTSVSPDDKACYIQWPSTKVRVIVTDPHHVAGSCGERLTTLTASQTDSTKMMSFIAYQLNTLEDIRSRQNKERAMAQTSEYVGACEQNKSERARSKLGIAR